VDLEGQQGRQQQQQQQQVELPPSSTKLSDLPLATDQALLNGHSGDHHPSGRTFGRFPMGAGSSTGGGNSWTHWGEEDTEGGPSLWSERGPMALLVLLYMMQGIPMGLTLGAMPFMLQSRLSFSQIGIFSLAAYPYSMKLLWSPIVDSCYSLRLGRRKSWIVPVQFISALLLYGCAEWVEELYNSANVVALTTLFFIFVLLAATQDIAVDGWALTLLSPRNVGYASTCQTIGTSTGFFTSFTVFLALQDPNFCNRHIRSMGLAQSLFGMDPHSSVGLVTLKGYLQFWGIFFAIATLGIWMLKPEKEALTKEELENAAKRGSSSGGMECSPLWGEIKDAYFALWQVVKLRAVWWFAALLLTYRLGVLVAESAFSLKLIDKGVPKETLAALVLFQFPTELLTAILAGRWAANYSPYRPFIVGYGLRLVVAAVSILAARDFPSKAALDDESWSSGGHTSYGALFFIISFATPFVSTLCFTAIGSFSNMISDPGMGGAYLTLLNTIANMGIILPKAPLYYLVDVLTVTHCTPPPDVSASGAALVQGLACPKKPFELGGKNACTQAGGTCAIQTDGFYTVCWASLALGIILGALYIKYLPRLMSLPISMWRAGGNGSLKGGQVDGKSDV